MLTQNLFSKGADDVEETKRAFGAGGAVGGRRARRIAGGFRSGGRKA
jgi:hypothetical protein